jgi:peptide deformylase
MHLIKEVSLLRKPCERVSVAEGLKFGRHMHTFLLTLNKQKLSQRAVGLAAPQVGIYKRVCVINYNGKKLTFINPEIVAHGTLTCLYEEQCLSLPGVKVKVERYMHIQVAADNLGRYNHFYDFEAAIVQHELDHLLETLITDRQDPNYKNSQGW